MRHCVSFLYTWTNLAYIYEIKVGGVPFRYIGFRNSVGRGNLGLSIFRTESLAFKVWHISQVPIVLEKFNTFGRRKKRNAGHALRVSLLSSYCNRAGQPDQKSYILNNIKDLSGKNNISSSYNKLSKEYSNSFSTAGFLSFLGRWPDFLN